MPVKPPRKPRNEKASTTIGILQLQVKGLLARIEDLVQQNAIARSGSETHLKMADTLDKSLQKYEAENLSLKEQLAYANGYIAGVKGMAAPGQSDGGGK